MPSPEKINEFNEKINNTDELIDSYVKNQEITLETGDFIRELESFGVNIKHACYKKALEVFNIKDSPKLQIYKVRTLIKEGKSDEEILNFVSTERGKIEEFLPYLRDAVKKDDENDVRYFDATKKRFDELKLPNSSEKDILNMGKTLKLPMFNSNDIKKNKEFRNEYFEFSKRKALANFSKVTPENRSIGRLIENPDLSILEKNEIALKSHDSKNDVELYNRIIDEVLSIDDSYMRPFTREEYIKDFEKNSYYANILHDNLAVGKIRDLGLLKGDDLKNYDDYTQFMCRGLMQGEQSLIMSTYEHNQFVDIEKLDEKETGDAFARSMEAGADMRFGNFIMKNATRDTNKIDETKIEGFKKIRKGLLIKRISEAMLEKPNITESEKEFITKCMNDKENGGMMLYEFAISEIMNLDSGISKEKTEADLSYEKHIRERGKHLISAMKMDGYEIDSERLDDLKSVLDGNSPRIEKEIKDLSASDDPIGKARENLSNMYKEVANKLNGALNDETLTKEDRWDKVKDSLAIMITLKINDKKIVQGNFGKEDVEIIQNLSSRDNILNIKDALLMEKTGGSVWKDTITSLEKDGLNDLVSSNISDDEKIGKLIKSYEKSIKMKITREKAVEKEDNQLEIKNEINI